MKQPIILIALLLSVSAYVYPQASGSFYTFQLGKKTAIFKYDEKNKTLFLQDDGNKSVDIKYPWAKDTVTAINPVTHQEETKIISYTSGEYHIETEMSYFDFLLLLKNKFQLHNTQKSLKVYSYNIYYETATQGGMIRVKYPETSEGVISKLNCLIKEVLYYSHSKLLITMPSLSMHKAGGWH